MCLILLAAQAHPRFSLIVAANRDEAYARPSAQAAFWKEHPQVFGGRDLEHGGTWLGLSLEGRFAAVTNYRQGAPRVRSAHSRGELTRDFLTSRDAPGAYVRAIEPRGPLDYNGFSLICGTPQELWFYSNRGGKPERISPGVHGLSNHVLDEPWPKVMRGIAELESLLDADESQLSSRLLNLLSDRAHAPDHLLPSTGIELARERALSASFVEGETYGTRASTVVLVETGGRTLFIERTYEAGGQVAGEVRQRFNIPSDVTRPRAAPVRA
jgi:uncharacterized protein with NRDE domain